MPIVNGQYQNPGWVDGQEPAIDAEELNAMSDTIVSNQDKYTKEQTFSSSTQSVYPESVTNPNDALNLLGQSAICSSTVQIPLYQEVTLDLTNPIVNTDVTIGKKTFKILSNDYEPSLNSSNGQRVLLIDNEVMMNFWTYTDVSYGGAQNWENTSLKNTLNSTSGYLRNFPQSIQQDMTTTYYSISPRQSNTVVQETSSVFILSPTEIGYPGYWTNGGSSPRTFSSLGSEMYTAKAFYLAATNAAANRNLWFATRATGYTDVSYNICIYTQVSYGYWADRSSSPGNVYVHPCFTLPYGKKYTFYWDGTNFYDEQSYISLPTPSHVNGTYDITVCEHGTYKGTGTYNSSGQSQYTFNTKPNFVLAFGPNSTNVAAMLFDNSSSSCSGALSKYNITCSVSGNTVSWYSISDAGTQLNSSGVTYTIINIP